VRDRLATLVPPVVVGVALLALWEAFVAWRDIKPYLLPKPSAIWDQIGDNHTAIWNAAKATGTNALLGLLVGVAVGVLLALIASRFKVFSEMVVPVAAAVNAVPIIALAPIAYNLFSATSDTPRRLVVTVVVFFPVFVNVLKGLTQVEAVHVELLRSYAASDSAILHKLRLPNALPFLFTSLKIAASLSVIAAVVAEYFGGLQNGLGSRITSAASNSAFPRAWAYVAAACALGLVFYVASAVLERILLPWQAKRRSAT
jgi:NitT/TauT family transport system permease protein